MNQYDICWAALPEPIGLRPVLLLSRNTAFQYLAKVIVAEITTTNRAIPHEVRVGRREGLDRPSVVSLDNVHVVRKTLLRERIGRLDPRRVEEVKRALGFALDWPELKVVGEPPAESQHETRN